MKIALAASEFINNDISFNVKKIKRLMLMAKEKGTELICFGESFIQGFDALTWVFDKDKNIALKQDSPIMQTIKNYTTDFCIDLLAGYIELYNSKIYSSYALISEGKIIHNHRRISTGWKEITKTDNHYKEGTKVELITYKGIKIALALCGDVWEFPDKFKRQEDLLIWGVYCDYSLEEWRMEEKEYAKHANTICENVAIINSICHNPNSHGGAWFVKEGKILSSICLDHENILVFDMKK